MNKLNYKKYNHLIIVPHRYLHLLPIHASPLYNNHILLNYFKKGVSYAPSCQLLQLTQDKQPFDFQNLLGVQDPTNNLVFSNIEVGRIKDFFTETTLFTQEKATKSAIINQQKLLSTYCSHFACHGEFNVKEPLKSALILVNHERLTLNDIFELNLSQCSLVTLSACETGITDATSISDEYIGLTSGFLSAGIPNVVSSLWKVNDLSTTLLMNKFYENLKLSPLLKSGRIACALNQTQTWLKNMTIEQFEQEIIKFKPYIEQLRKGQRIIVTENIRKTKERQPYPFASPYYWAGFIVVGF
ncbi:MAG: CHAT domain-containing protein [Crocosphaera sp.]